MDSPSLSLLSGGCLLWYVANNPICRTALWIPKQMTNYKQWKICRRRRRLGSKVGTASSEVKCSKMQQREQQRMQAWGQIGKRAGAVWNWKWNSSPVETSGSADTQGAVKLKCRNTRDKSGKTPGTIAELQLCQKCKTLELSMYTC